MKKFGILTFVVFLSSCAAPNFYNGKYYMAGDSDCVSMKQLDDNKIVCYDHSKKETGHRAAMTDQQLQMYMHQQSMSQANAAIIYNSMRLSNQLNCTSNRIGNQVFTNCW